MAYVPKTTFTKASVAAFINSVPNSKRRADAKVILKMLQEVTKERPRMWGPSIVGFGEYHYKYATGHEGDAPRAGFSPRSSALTVYMATGFEGSGALLQKLGPHKKTVSCLYIKSLKDIDLAALKKLMALSYKYINKKYPR